MHDNAENAMELTIHEAAMLAAVKPGAVSKALENGIMKAGRSGRSIHGGSKRRLPLSSVAYFSAIDKSGLSGLEIKHKRTIWRMLRDDIAHGKRPLPTIEFAPGTTINFDRLAAKPMEDAERYIAARNLHIVVDPEIKGGMPVLRGTRMSVYSVLGRIEGGETVGDIMNDNPDISSEALEAAITYARTHPLRGRPGEKPWSRSTSTVHTTA